MTKATDKRRISRRHFCRRAMAAAAGAAVAGQARAEQSFKMTKKQAGYVLKAQHATQTCAQCLYFISPKDCVLVEGPISPNGWCTYYGD